MNLPINFVTRLIWKILFFWTHHYITFVQNKKIFQIPQHSPPYSHDIIATKFEGTDPFPLILPSNPALRAGGRGLFDFCAFVVDWVFILFFLSWRQGCFRDPRRSSMRICFQTLAHERSGLSLHSSDMVYISSWRSWRLQARCTIPSFSFFVFLVKLSYCYHYFNMNKMK